MALAGFAIFGIAVATVAYAAEPLVDCVWIGGDSGDWNNPKNWNTNASPGDQNRVVFRNSAVVSATEFAVAPGAIEVDMDCTVEFTNHFPQTAVIRGGGVIRVKELPENATVSLQAEGWYGVLWLDGVAVFNDFDPAEYGNGLSRIRFSDCAGSFATGISRIEVPIELWNDGGGSASLELTSGAAGQVIGIDCLSGNGTLYVSFNTETADLYRLEVDDFTAFTGSIVMDEGDILLQENGSYEIGKDSLWRPQGGYISVTNGATLVNRGIIDGQVVGEGTVSYRGTVGSDKIEAAARYGEDSWRGEVIVEDAVLTRTSFANGGNAGSRLTVNGAKGTLVPQQIEVPVCIGEDGLEITDGLEGGLVRFAKVFGPGRILLNGVVNLGSVEVFQLDDVVDYTGRLEARDSNLAFSIGGGTDCSGAGAIDFANEALVRGNLGWRAERVSFGEKLQVTNAIPGDAMVYTRVSQGNYEDVHVQLLSSEVSSKVNYGLDYDYINHWLLLVAVGAHPEVQIGDLNIDYGPDLTNATLSVEVTDFWEGVDYNGGIHIEVVIKDGQGKDVKMYSVKVDGTGTYDVGVLPLPESALKDYTYEMTVKTKRSTYDSEEMIAGIAKADPVAHLQGKLWIEENVTTFSYAENDPRRTGKWVYNGSEPRVVITNAQLAVQAGFADTNRASFVAITNSCEDIVKIDVRFSPYDGDTSGEAEPGCTGMFLAEGPDFDGNYALSGYDPETTNLTYLFGAELKDDGVTHVLHTVFNYTTGLISYHIDGAVLTNDQGRAFFKMTDEMRDPANRVKRVTFSGNTLLDAIEGGQYTADLAQTISADGTETNRYATIDEAVAASTNGVNKLGVLWDVVWHPSAGDVGRTFDFETNGHRLIIDAAVTNNLHNEGYVLIDNGDGSYTMGVIEYELRLASNDLSSDDSAVVSQMFSVTNTAFFIKPVSECFSRDGYSFANWNEERNGSGETNWTDEGWIDMTAFGLTNKTLYAQWTVAIRAVRIEASDPSVYIEIVSTNGVEHTGVRYFRPGGDNIQALVPVENGCADLVIRFSTDLEKRLSFINFKKPGVVLGNEIIPYANEPTNLVADVNGLFSAPDLVSTWAASHFLPVSAVMASPFALTSAKLGLDSTIDEKSEIVISDFQLTDDGCSFKVTKDGELIGNADRDALRGLVKVSSDLKEWSDAEISSVEDGIVNVVTDTPGAFIKIVIPKDGVVKQN